MNNDLSLLGEFGIIDLFRSHARRANPWVTVGIGDDCAVMDMDGQRSLLVTTDMLLEDVHFRRSWARPRQLGWKSAAVNISDIAAMGGTPSGAFLGIGIPTDMEMDDLTGFRRGLDDCLRRYGIDLLGGDTVASTNGLAVSITLIGTAPSQDVVRRSGAMPGQRVFVAGTLGASAAGLFLLESNERPGGLDADSRQELIRAHLEPRPLVDLGRTLAERHLATAMIDLSDGLLSDLGHLCDESRVGAVIKATALPICEPTRILADSLGLDPLEWAISGGEDYGLVFCTAPEDEAPVTAVGRDLDIPISAIGWTTGEESVIRLSVNHSMSAVSRKGWDHFAKTGRGEPDEPVP